MHTKIEIERERERERGDEAMKPPFNLIKEKSSVKKTKKPIQSKYL